MQKFQFVFHIILLLFIVIINTNFAATYYVDATNGNDNNSGLSPSQAWQTINKVNNFNFQTGDSICFKRNDRFVGYTLKPPQDYLTFTAYGVGARPVIDGQSTRYCVDLETTARDHITFSHLKFVHGTTANIDTWDCSYITIEYCNIDSSSGSSNANINIYSGMGTNLVIRYSTLRYAQACTYGGHGIYIDGTSNSLLEYDTISYNGNDGIRIAYGKSTHTNNITIRYCEVRYNGDEIISDDGSTNSQFYYNIFENETTTWSDGISLFLENGFCPSGDNYYNNTFIIHDPGSNGNCAFDIKSSSITNMVVKNNIFYLADNNGGWAVYNQISNSGTWTFDNNLYYRANGSQNHLYNWNGNTLSSITSWQNLGYDAHSKFQDPMFVNLSAGDFELDSGSPAINLGQNVGLTKDILGNPIIVNPDAGAFEYQDTQSSNNIKLNASVILGGCYSNGTMSTALLNRGFLPHNQPYNATPWNYNGTETVNNFPANTVDWVLLELRSNTSSSSIVARRAALLLSNGSIVDLDGTSPVMFNGIQSGSYYLVIEHRNHLGVMSANKLNFSTSGITNYTFTDSQSKAYGTNSMESLGNSIYGLYPGDGNSDGTISQSDITNVWLPQFLNGIDGYNSADFNLDGSVTAADNNLYWLLDNGKSSQVPK